MLKTWSIASLISMYDAELGDNRNQVDAKIDPMPGMLFSKHPVIHSAPMFYFAPTLCIYIYVSIINIKYIL